MKYFFGFALVLIFCAGCTERKLVQAKNYESYLAFHYLDKAVEESRQELLFWETRLQQDPESFVNLMELGKQYISLFGLKGNINDLNVGDSLLKAAASKLNNSDPYMLQALAQTAITKHQFRQAAEFNNTAAQQKASPYIHALLSFDVDMELGQYHLAKGNLDVLKDRSSFDLLIRQAKYLDHTGNLEGAIQLMEAAFKKIENTNKKSLYCWALSNLGDMYGHAGRIEESYAAYLQVLGKDPANLYALKGIAWIAYAHDNNAAEAKRILQFIRTSTNDPDILLDLAEIAAHEGDQQAENNYKQQFVATVSHGAYHDMYNKALIEIYAEEATHIEKALELANREVDNRPTPETYSWLAWVHFKKGDVAKAYELFSIHTKGRSFEPEVILKGAYILEAVGKDAEAKKYFEECAGSRFELGPVTYGQVAKKL